MEDYYTIQTPEHHSSLLIQLHSLQKQGVMCDVILAAEDGEVMAHKVILMAVSKYFREKLSPVVSSAATRIFLKGIPVIELANLVKYIYTGKLLIAKETMDITLEVAEILQLNGVVNGYKEILAYEHLMVQPSDDGSEPKPDKQSAEYAAFNVQVEQYSEEQMNKRQAYGSDQMQTQDGYQEPQVENDGAVHVASSETITTAPPTSLNTSTEYPFETNIFEDQYYDVSVGSTVNVQSDSQINTMPSLQKMTSTISSDINQSEHQDLLSVAIETLTDVNYLSSSPSKDRHAYSQALSYSTSVPHMDTSAQGQLSDPLAPGGALTSTPTPTAMVVNSSNPAATKHTRRGDRTESIVPAAKGNIPVYRVSLPPTMPVIQDPELNKPGRPAKPDNDNTRSRRARPRKTPPDERVTSPGASKMSKLIVSPQLTRSSPRSKELEAAPAESKRKMALAKPVNTKSDPHLNKVVEDLKTKVSEDRAAKKKASEMKDTETTCVQTETSERMEEKTEESVNSSTVTQCDEESIREDFGQSVNFDSDVEENEYEDSDLTKTVDKVETREETSSPDKIKGKDAGGKPKDKGGSVDQNMARLPKATVLTYKDVAEQTAKRVETTLRTPSNKPSEENIGVLKPPIKSPNEIITRGKSQTRQQLVADENNLMPEKPEMELPEKADNKTPEKNNEIDKANNKASEETSNKSMAEISSETPEKDKSSKVIADSREDLESLKTQKGKDETPEKSTLIDSSAESVKDSELLKTPKGKSEDKEDSIEEGMNSGIKEDLRSSASKRKTKAPRKFTDYETGKKSLNKDIPIVRTRRSSKNGTYSAQSSDIKEGNSNVEKNSSEQLLKASAELAVPITEKIAAKSLRQSLQPVVKLTKASKEEMMNIARKIAASSSPKKRKLEKIQVEIEQTGTEESVKKKTKKPTEQQPVAALKNRQKDEDTEESDGKEDCEDLGYPSSPNSDSRKTDDKGNESTPANESKKPVNETPKVPKEHIACTKCNRTFRYTVQLNKHAKHCTVTKSASKKERNIFADLQDDPDKSPSEEKSRTESPESTSSVTMEIVPFSRDDVLRNLVQKDKRKSRLFMCQEKNCTFTTENCAEATKHQDVHSIKGACNECGMCFSSDAQFRDHECFLLCNSCNIMFETRTDMAAHLKERHEHQDCLTEDANKTGDSTEDQNDETSKKVKTKTEKEIKVEKDELDVSKSTKAARRGKKSASERIWACFLCEVVCPSKEEMLKHENTHDLICSCCNIKFETAGKLKAHVNVKKRKSTELMCFICQKSFSRRTDQRKHMFKFHGSPAMSQDGKQELKVFQCDICSFIAWSERLLNLHKKAHKGVKDVPCPQCKKMFLSQYDVNRHVKTVHGEQRYRFKCEHEGCDFATAAMRGLKTHIELKHSEERTLILCPFCEYKAALKGNLDKHLRTVHKLEVVSKCTLRDREKYGDLKHGTIITKDGKEVTEDDIMNYKRSGRSCKKEEDINIRSPRVKRKKTIEEFTQEIMAKHMKRLESPAVEKDYRSATLDKALAQPSFPQASANVRDEAMLKKHPRQPRLALQYDKIDADEALQYADDEDYEGMGREVIVDDGIVPIPSTGMSVGNEVFIIEAGKSENIIESDFTQPILENEYEDETSRSLRVLTNNCDNEDETSRSLRVLTSLLQAGQHA